MLGKIAALSAMFSLLFVQFVHAALMDGGDLHSTAGAHDLVEIHQNQHHHQTLPHEKHDDDHDHELDLVHNLMHDHHMVPHSDCLQPVTLYPGRAAFFPRQDFNRGLSLAPPVPPPLS